MREAVSSLILRPGRAKDIERLQGHIVQSARLLSQGFYTKEEIEAALTHVFGVDSELVRDGTYFIVENDEGTIAGCGGWSFRPTLFGGDQYADRCSGRLNPTIDAAKIRAFFISPAFARRGVARQLLNACEDAAHAAGFTRLELMATLPGVPFYTACGFRGDAERIFDLGGTPVRFLPMIKSLQQEKE